MNELLAMQEELKTLQGDFDVTYTQWSAVEELLEELGVSIEDLRGDCIIGEVMGMDEAHSYLDDLDIFGCASWLRKLHGRNANLLYDLDDELVILTNEVLIGLLGTIIKHLEEQE